MICVGESVLFDDASDAFHRVGESMQCEILRECLGHIKRLVELGKVENLRIFMNLHESFERRYLLHERLQKRTFSDAILPDNSDSFSSRHDSIADEKK